MAIIVLTDPLVHRRGDRDHGNRRATSDIDDDPFPCTSVDLSNLDGPHIVTDVIDRRGYGITRSRCKAGDRDVEERDQVGATVPSAWPTVIRVRS
jgi:hypothetical protein